MESKSRRPSLSLLAILLSAVGIAPMLNYGLSATSDLIISDLGISETQFGLLATACFGFGAIGNVVFGKFADRQPDRTLLLLVFGMAALAMILAAIPGGYVLLLVASAISGLAQSFPNGVTNRILAQRVPGTHRMGWTGIKQSGVQVSQLVASLAFPVLAAWIGWQGANLIGALIAGLIGLLVAKTINSYPVLPAEPKEAPKPSVNGMVRPESSTKFIIVALSVFGFVNGMGVQATNVYLPLFAVRELDFSLVLGGLTAAVAGAVGVSARIGWGKMMSLGVPAPKLLLLLAVMAFCGAGTFLAAYTTGHAGLLWLAVILHGASALGVSVVLMASLLRSVPVTLMGSATGWVTAGQFGGFTIGPLAMGMLISSPGGFAAGWIAVGLVYLVCVALGVYLVMRRRPAVQAD